MKIYFYAAISAFIVSFLFCKLLIPILKRVRAGQNILSYVKEHKSKGGTPTMGGIAFVAAAIAVTAFFLRERAQTVVLTMAVGLAYMCVGLLDDFLKCRRKDNLGLRAWQKFAFQACIALLTAFFCVKNGLTGLSIPFTKIVVNIGFWAFPLIAFVFVATVNAVNLTDGLDGLASAVSIPFFITLGILIALQGGNDETSVLCFALVGALAAYLLFNSSPASVFMGDTGSLSLGGFAACIASFTGNALYILTVGVCFVISVVSVIIQVVYFKATGGRRVFLMAPLHHHFQEKGNSETKISYAYFAVTALIGAVCIALQL
ncbi:MAG: phospho-N-acetylmuramoyl-pentapeptide-transferase [Clostridia bacterium]|nr:phospho-N-acetylmuramoyl-pentapeptide-transferase [Clostridia bacterium]